MFVFLSRVVTDQYIINGLLLKRKCVFFVAGGNSGVLVNYEANITTVRRFSQNCEKRRACPSVRPHGIALLPLEGIS